MHRSVVWVGHGAPCQPGEFLIELHRFVPGQKPKPFTTLFTLPISGGARVSAAKAKIAAHWTKLNGKDATDGNGGDGVGGAGEASLGSINPLHLRLRDKKANEAGSILRDDRTLRKSIMNLTDGEPRRRTRGWSTAAIARAAVS